MKSKAHLELAAPSSFICSCLSPTSCLLSFFSSPLEPADQPVTSMQFLNLLHRPLAPLSPIQSSIELEELAATDKTLLHKTKNTLKKIALATAVVADCCYDSLQLATSHGHLGQKELLASPLGGGFCICD